MDTPASLHRRAKQLEKQRLQPGTIVSFTIIRHPPQGFGHEPYAVGLIQLQDGTSICAQLIVDTQNPPAIGATVIPRMRRIRTLENGLHMNDLKYEVVAKKAEPILEIHAYVLALTGPSGVGKTTITRSLMSLLQSYSEQVPIYTTRARKPSDVEPYIHVSEARFDALIRSGEMIAHTSMPSKSEQRRYGYRKKDIEAIWAKRKLPIVVTDIHLLDGLAKSLGRRTILSCGLLPPGDSHRRRLSALLHRLRGRGRETDEQINERLQTAGHDLRAFDTHSHLFDHMLVNDKLEVCVESIQKLVKQ